MEALEEVKRGLNGMADGRLGIGILDQRELS
jgi:hypothetical protein